MKYGSTRGNKRKVTIDTAHTVTMDNLIEPIKQTAKLSKQLRDRMRAQHSFYEQRDLDVASHHSLHHFI
jgi:hypothetical protein